MILKKLLLAALLNLWRESLHSTILRELQQPLIILRSDQRLLNQEDLDLLHVESILMHYLHDSIFGRSTVDKSKIYFLIIYIKIAKSYRDGMKKKVQNTESFCGNYPTLIAILF